MSGHVRHDERALAQLQLGVKRPWARVVLSVSQGRVRAFSQIEGLEHCGQFGVTLTEGM